MGCIGQPGLEQQQCFVVGKRRLTVVLTPARRAISRTGTTAAWELLLMMATRRPVC